MKRLTTYSAVETANVGYMLGKHLQKGDIICLSGALGTGKTAFTGGIAEALGIVGYITSPTFTIVNEYEGRIPLYHFDVYRISSPDDMFEIGFEEYIEGNGVVVIEWAEMIDEILPVDRIEVKIEKDIAAGADIRLITINFKGDRYSEVKGGFGL